ncbi:hypothetical protein HBB16_03220 [Pseudonocardia sp. MCCB 268]|nr:hypothetical protein [Pseudonocardia cytotoxica]
MGFRPPVGASSRAAPGSHTGAGGPGFRGAGRRRFRRCRARPRRAAADPHDRRRPGCRSCPALCRRGDAGGLPQRYRHRRRPRIRHGHHLDPATCAVTAVRDTGVVETWRTRWRHPRRCAVAGRHQTPPERHGPPGRAAGVRPPRVHDPSTRTARATPRRSWSPTTGSPDRGVGRSAAPLGTARTARSATGTVGCAGSQAEIVLPYPLAQAARSAGGARMVTGGAAAPPDRGWARRRRADPHGRLAVPAQEAVDSVCSQSV